jgi:hypothetical protein
MLTLKLLFETAATQALSFTQEHSEFISLLLELDTLNDSTFDSFFTFCVSLVSSNATHALAIAEMLVLNIRQGMFVVLR